MNEFTRNDLIQSHNQNMLVQLGQNNTNDCFMVGDIVNEEWENAIHNGWDKPVSERGGDYVTRLRICQAAAYYYGKQARTIRYYADVSQAFPADVRNHFEHLSFSHFAHARKYEDWQDYLEYGMSGGFDGGRVNVDGCEAEWSRRLREQYSCQPETPPSTDTTPPPSAFSFSGLGQRAIGMLAKLARRDGLSDGARSKLMQAASLISEVLAENSEYDKIEL